jgi:WD40 repeat protein
MAAGSLSDIKIWTMKEDPCHLEDPVLLFGQHGLILCMNFSKQVNWLVVGTSEGYIILWKEFSLKNWHSSHAIKGVSNK